MKSRKPPGIEKADLVNKTNKKSKQIKHIWSIHPIKLLTLLEPSSSTAILKRLLVHFVAAQIISSFSIENELVLFSYNLSRDPKKLGGISYSVYVLRI